MKIKTTRFGELEVADDQVIRFPHGLPGFPEEREFALLPHGAESPFWFLQSTTEENLTFLLVDPFVFVKDYAFELDDEVAEELAVSEDNPPQVLTVATVKDNIADMTVNLLAPIVINRVKRIGRQLILDKPEYSLRHRLFPHGLPQAGGERGE